MGKDIYERRGVSSQKEDIHEAVKNLDRGLFPSAFCKILSDTLGEDENYCNIFHADGAGTKSSLAYAYWKKTGDLSVFKGIAQDAIVMNLDDLLCAGITNEPILYSSTIGRNKILVSVDVIKTIINGTQEFIYKLKSFGINITYSGGETADVGDLVRTLIVDGGMVTRAERNNIIAPIIIQPGDVIVGLSSTGKATYEENKNSGMGSNGLTSARHDMFNENVGREYPETYDHNMDDRLTYCGEYNLTDPSPIEGIDFGKFVLSPTRTYAPILLTLFKQIQKRHIHGMIHCSGGGQTKIMQFLNGKVEVVKDKLFPTPELFTLIQKSANTNWKEMYRTFNMGHRMELYCPKEMAPIIIAVARQFNVEAKIIGQCINRKTDSVLTINSPHGLFKY